MLQKKYLILYMLCVSTVTYGAAKDSEVRMPFVIGGEKIELIDCFKSELIEVPGPELYYSLIAVKHVKVASTGTATPPNKCIEGVVGYSSSPSAELAVELSAEVAAAVAYLYSKKHTTELILSFDWLERGFQGLKKDVSHIPLAKQSRVRLFGFLGVTLRNLDLCFTLGWRVEDLFEQPMIVSGHHMALLHDLRLSCQGDTPMQDRFAALKKYAQILCAQAECTHLAPVAFLDREALAMLVARELYSKAGTF